MQLNKSDGHILYISFITIKVTERILEETAQTMMCKRHSI